MTKHATFAREYSVNDTRKRAFEELHNVKSNYVFNYWRQPADNILQTSE